MRSRTQVANAQATLSFWGNHVELYGATSDNHGAFSVALDGAAPVMLNGTSPIFRPQTLLVRASPPLRSDQTLSLPARSTCSPTSRTARTRSS
jgi:hypothetical protein